MSRYKFQAQLIPALKRLSESNMEAELKHLSLPVEERIEIEAKYWWNRAMGIARRGGDINETV